jgi:hypothetical protein
MLPLYERHHAAATACRGVAMETSNIFSITKAAHPS